MQQPIFQVDAFTDRLFGGNPAAVCPLSQWLPTPVMQAIAMENAVAETAFFVPIETGFAIRWFTPEIEMDLCGHATLAAAHVIVHHFHYPHRPIRFQSASGELLVAIVDQRLCLNFPARPPQPSDCPALILDAFGAKPIDCLQARDYLLVFEQEEQIRQLQPDRSLLNQINLDPGGIIITAPGQTVDFVSRFFVPQASIFEDPVTGSAHCSLIPYWSQRLGKAQLRATQLSPRQGHLFCTHLGERVLIAGDTVTYLQGYLQLPESKFS